MNRKNLEITLSQNIVAFANPDISLEQYITPPRVSANLIQRAYELGDIAGKKVIDLCAGTGMLSVAAALFKGLVTSVEIDESATKVMKNNFTNLGIQSNIIHSDVLTYNDNLVYDTAILNPPFGIQQKKFRDIKFIKKAHSLAPVAYTIVDGSAANKNSLPKLLESNGIQITEMYEDQFPLLKSYPWHKFNKKINSVLVLRTIKSRFNVAYE